MKNYFSNLLRKTSVGKMLEISSSKPKSGVSLSRKGILFSSFDDWYQLASKGTVSSPYAFHWREMALTFPRDKAAQNISSFLHVIKTPNLADQAKAILFSIPAEKLPNHRILENLVAEDEEQERIKRLLIRKKLFGNAKFVKEFLKDVISPVEKEEEGEDDKVKFTVEGGREFSVKSDILKFTRIQRESTIFGIANIIAVTEKNYDDAGMVRYYFFIIDGDKFVCRMREQDFLKLKLNSKITKKYTYATNR